MWAPPLAMIGALTVASCVRIPTPIVFPQVAMEHPSFAPTMEAYTTAPVRWTNRVDVPLNGEQIFPAQVEEDRSHSKPVDPRSWRARSLWKRFWEFLSVPVQDQL